MASEMNKKLYTYTMYTGAQVVADLASSLTQGLSDAEVKKRRAQYGTNELTKQTISWVGILVSQFTSPFIYLLLIIAGLTFALGDVSNGIIICACVILNAMVGFYQEYKADKSVLLLKKYLVQKVHVLRDAKEQEVPSTDLVPGDILLVYPGDIIPADVRFLSGHHLHIDESALTGETIAIAKDPHALKEIPKELFDASNIGFAGTTVLQGKGMAIVVATGLSSTLGDINALAVRTKKVSSFSIEIKRFSHFILLLISVTMALVFVVHILMLSSKFEIINLAIFSVALGIAIVPEALPVVTTFGFTRGALSLIKHEVVVKRLSAIEDLGSIELLCTDKTGTLTQNKMSIAAVYGKERDVLVYAALASGLHEHTLATAKGFDAALWNVLTPEEYQSIGDYQLMAEMPFDSRRRRSLVLLTYNERHHLIVRGAFNDVLAQCQTLSAAEKESVERWIAHQDAQGNRIIAVAHKGIESMPHDSIHVLTHEHSMNMVGLIAFEDPLKETARGAVVKAGRLGIGIKIVSGDGAQVCGVIGKKVGLITDVSEVITGDYFARHDANDKARLAEEGKVFARINPAQKHEIIQLLQKKYKVGYMGDGVNDAPALKAAHVALAVDDAADIAREVADIILFRPSLSVIINGVEEGRIIFANTLKYIKITLAAGFGHFYALAIATLIIDFLPMLPAQLLILNFLSDVPLIALSTDTMSLQEVKAPQKYDFKEIIVMATIFGLVISTFDFIIFSLFYHKQPAVLQTNWFISCVLNELIFTLSARSTLPFYKAPVPSRSLLILVPTVAALAIGLPYTSFGQYWIHFAPPRFYDLLLILLLSLGCFCATEGMKMLYNRFYRGRSYAKEV